MNGGECVVDSKNVSRCPTNFPSGPSFGATFDRALVRDMANVVGTELRAMFALQLGKNYMSLDCWGPVVNLNRDPRWGRNGEGGTEDAYAMGQLAEAWTAGFQSPRPSLINNSSLPPRTLLQGVMTLKHMAANSLENTQPFNRHNFDANATFGVNAFVMRDYYLRPFERAIRGADARGIMCSYNSALGVPTCLSKVISGSRKNWQFRGYVTSDSDSVHDAWASHHYVPDSTTATALALMDGQCDIDSGDTYNSAILPAVEQSVRGLKQRDVDRAVTNSLRQRFDLGLFDPKEAYNLPGVDDVGTDASQAMSLRASQEAIVLLRNDDALLPLQSGGRIAVLGPHANAQTVLMQPYPFTPFCADNTNDCLISPFAAIALLNGGDDTTSTAPGCDLFNKSQAGFSEALAEARAADTVVLGLGIETCGMNPAHNVNPRASSPGHCYQEKGTEGYVFPDEYLELEAHDRTTIALPEVQLELAKAIFALHKPTVVFLMNGGAVALDGLLELVNAAQKQQHFPVAIIEAFYPGPHGGTALAQGIFGKHNRWGRLPYTIYPSSFVQEADMSMHDLRVAPGRTYRYYRNATYEFGQGLSLSKWGLTSMGNPYSCLSLLSTANPHAPCEVVLKLTNKVGAAALAGDCVVTAYFRTTEPQPWRQANSAGIAASDLLVPRKTLFNYQRIIDVGAGASVDVRFNVSAADLAVADEVSGDWMIKPGAFTLRFEDGSFGASAVAVEMNAMITGPATVLDKFPTAG
eukprot:g981.t1